MYYAQNIYVILLTRERNSSDFQTRTLLSTLFLEQLMVDSVFLYVNQTVIDLKVIDWPILCISNR